MSVYFKNNIKAIREEKGITQQQLANHLQVNKSQICRYEMGEQGPRSDALKSIADYLGVGVEMIVGEAGNLKYEIDEEGTPVVDFSGGQVVRNDLFSQNQPYDITIYPDGIRFSTGCVRAWQDISHVSIVVLDEIKVMVLRMSDEEEYDSQRWVNIRDGKRYGRKITARGLSEEIYNLMNWSRGYYYKINGRLGKNKNDLGEKIWVFDFDKSRMFPMTEKARIKAGVRNEDLEKNDIERLDTIEKEKEEEKIYREKMKEEGKDPGPLKAYVFYPDKWGQYTFGLPVSEHGEIPEVSLDKKT